MAGKLKSKLKAGKLAFFFFTALFFCPILAANPNLAVGDLVFRMGTVMDSRIIASLSQSQFSHIGMIVQTSPEVLVIHASSEGEPRQDLVFLTSLREFSKPQNAKYIAVARPNYLTDEQKNAIATHLIQAKGQPFLLQPKEEVHRYCTTLIFDEIKRLKPDFELNWQQLNIPLMQGEYLLPQAFIDHQDFDWIIPPP